MKSLIPASAALILIGVYLTGCVSATIVGSGKRYEHLLKKKTTMHDVRESLGDPEWSRQYVPSIPISETEEYKSYLNNTKNHYPPFIWGEKEQANHGDTALCEVYTRKGPYEDVLRGQGHGMVGAMTLGVGDVLLIPSAINEKGEMNKKYYSLTFWYDTSGHYVGYYYGDIRSAHRQF